jgi:hypothetical protein
VVSRHLLWDVFSGLFIGVLQGIHMLIRLGFDIQFDVPAPVAMVALFHVHPTRCEIVPGLVESGGSRLRARYATCSC